jgi:hypothetical protein
MSENNTNVPVANDSLTDDTVETSDVVVENTTQETKPTSSDGDDMPDVHIEYDEGEVDNNGEDGGDEEPEKAEENNEDSEYKYTKVDNLDEDPFVTVKCPSKKFTQKYVCMSFVSPEGVMNTTMRSVKIRGVFETEEEANEHCKKLQRKDKYFDVFVGECGKWLAWDPDPTSATSVKYRNKKLDKLMAQQQKRQMNELNELVGRKKELIDKKDKSHKRRVADQIVSGKQESGTSEYKDKATKDAEKKKKKKVKVDRSRNNNLDAIRARMLKTLNKRKKEKENNKEEQLKAAIEEGKSNVESRQESLNTKKEASNTVENNLEKIKAYLKNKSA